ncbi:MULTISPECIES: caspase, EACC1-associated type [unclassified Streptomyces]|uniref:caspase family protein n=1 Tax=unclassified Streptomyces TaxID=2593676 RepID=UPI002023DEC5|nr:caspase family protein [Streptomyces sp. A 4/2]WSV58418.1 caspase family protein [Streptomyces sp. NBC_01014]
MGIESTAGVDSHAILIGVSEYSDTQFPRIPAARNNLDAILHILTNPLLCAWPGRITTISDPTSRDALSMTIAEIAERTTGVLLVYYAGHGALSPRGDLCLTVGTTHFDRPALTGVPWDDVAGALRTSPARTRIAILDCCFAGQAIEALAATRTDTTVADIAHVEGVYTLTATTRNHTAHVPPLEQQAHARTSFTGQLVDLITEGIPHGPETLTLGAIYPVLRHRLATKALPLPNQRGTDLADRFVLTHNAWCRGTGLSTPPRVEAGRPDTGPGTGQAQSARRRRPRRKVLVAAATVVAVLAGGIAAIRYMPPPPSPPTSKAEDGVHGDCYPNKEDPIMCVFTSHVGRYVRDITVRSEDKAKGDMHSSWGNFDSDKESPREETDLRVRWTPNRKQTGPNARWVCGSMQRDGKNVASRCVDLDNPPT